MKRILFLIALAFVPFANAATDPATALQGLKKGEWLDYSVPVVGGERAPCCFEWDDRRPGRTGCSLVQKERNFGSFSDDPLPPGDTLRIFVRRGDAGYDRVLAVAESCPVHTGDVRVVTLADADADASVRMFERELLGDSRKDRGMGLHALAMHRTAAAGKALTRMTDKSTPRALRKDALFWLAQSRGTEGYAALARILDSSDDDDLLRHAVFCLTQSDAPQATTRLAQLTREHPESDVRGEALFWLAQEKAPGAEAAIERALTQDPSNAVRKKAVFAASQLPADRAIPLLKRLIAQDGPRDIRREAFFWLAQVNDDRALDTFDELLGAPTKR